MRTVTCLVFLSVSLATAQQLPVIEKVDHQPLAAQVSRLLEALQFLGEPLPAEETAEMKRLASAPADPHQAVTAMQSILDRHCLAGVEINPESRVKVQEGPAKAELVEQGWRTFLVKVINQAGITPVLAAESPNAGMLAGSESYAVSRRWLDIRMFDKQPMRPRLSGLEVEYRILQLFSRDGGKREARLEFNVGQGTQDLGFRSQVDLLFNARPATKVTLRVFDSDDRPTTASFLVRDAENRVYPSQVKRLAPDLAFQPQVYRGNGDFLLLPPGDYTVEYTRGPEYRKKTQRIHVGDQPMELAFRLERWVDPAKMGWYSGDHHIHAAGCAHYEKPTEGVYPRDMMRYILGEDLKVGSVLSWGPGWYFQKTFFGGKDNQLSTKDNLMRYDVEVSGFPSSHAGHLVLLGLTEQDYPGTKRIEDWPTWDLPILRWGKSQKAVVGFAHSGWGLEVKSSALPNYEMPGFDGIGANEYIVDVTYPDTVDFISTMDTPSVWELNIWYQTLNVGFRTRVSGETDFPCITDSRVGQGRVYAKVDGGLSYAKWLESVRSGRSYVADGRSHLMDFRVNGVELGTHNSEVQMAAGGSAHVTLKAAAYLDPVGGASEQLPSWARTIPGDPDDSFLSSPGNTLRDRPYSERPFWHIERARAGNTREVAVEIVVDGKPVARKNIVADGQVRDLEFDVPVEQSGWIAARILPSSHTNPIFVIVNGKPMRPLRASAEWCLAAVNQCWTQKAPKISARELPEARQAYDHARETYKKLIGESEKQ